ncbi:DUF1289 domain-containing protein [Marinomonas pollencensis]|uniref:Fe-S protein YdhL (DUF1289 family) n=1 Tax=Marinomonas pollencensis TaxID=491954 RepID=A0A3E0DAD2_9GAMM|nr:DUF1289 domain-containing protein [Marinomonas pollencensis]REG79537.1 hypothetical protein DFP81_11831 [Marinomonas pollencensis]
MEQIELFTIENPCRGICENSAKGFCKGCLRSREERFHWHSLSNESRHQVLELCRQRRQRLLKARQKRLQSDSSKALPYGMEEESGAPLEQGAEGEVFELTREAFDPEADRVSDQK